MFPSPSRRRNWLILFPLRTAIQLRLYKMDISEVLHTRVRSIWSALRQWLLSLSVFIEWGIPFGVGIAMGQWDEYGVAWICFGFATLSLVLRTFFWKGLEGRGRATVALQIIFLAFSAAFFLLMTVLTYAKKDDKPWSPTYNQYVSVPLEPKVLLPHMPVPFNWMPKVDSPPVLRPPAPIIVSAPSAPEPKKADVAFAFYSDSAVNVSQRTMSLPLEGAEVTVVVTFVVTGDVAAKDGMLWIRICNHCIYASEPPGFSADPHKPQDRAVHFDVLYPNVQYRVEFRIVPPVYNRNIGNFQIAGYYACENCPPVDSSKPQQLTISMVKRSPATH